jgi:hypothetical protein
MMLRWMILTLVAANVLFWLWGHDGLRALGLGPDVVSEPARVIDQIKPDAVRVAPMANPSERSDPSESKGN